MSKRHKHYDCIIAWAEGKQIQFYDQYYNRGWVDIDIPTWFEDHQYRIKPESKPESKPDIRARLWSQHPNNNFHLVFVFDGETKAFKTVEFHDE